MPKWSGADYLKRTNLLKADGTENKHWSGMRSPKTGMVCDPTFRDIGQALAFLMKESLQACSQTCYPEDVEANLALDTIGQFMAKIWNESLVDNLGGLGQFQVLYARMAEIPRGTEVYNAWCHLFVQTYFCYLFTVQKMANGLREGWLEEAAEFNAMLTVVSSLPEDLRKQVVQHMSSSGMWPSNLAYGKLIRRLEDFLSVCKEGQELRAKADTETKEEE